MAPFKTGDVVRIKSLTDVDDKTRAITTDEEAKEEGLGGILGRTAIVTEPVLNDYYECCVQLIKPLGELGDPVKGYGDPPVLAMLYCDLEVVK